MADRRRHLPVYPPAVGRFRGADGRTALAIAGLIAVGLAVELVGHLTRIQGCRPAGGALTLVGAAGYALLLAGLLRRLRNR